MTDCKKQIDHVLGRPPLIVLSQDPSTETNSKIQEYYHLDFFKEDFWNYTCLRFFFIELYMRQNRIDRVLHIENDNLLFVMPLEDWLSSRYKGQVAVAPITDSLDGAGIMYVDTLDALSQMNDAILVLMRRGIDDLRQSYGFDMNEMRFLNILRTSGLAPVAALPVLPEDDGHYVFDPASYGQSIDGNSAAPGIPTIEERHIVGKQILSGAIKVGRGTAHCPYVAGSVGVFPLVNLHIHSKRLHRFTSY
jgi:hypothetical protein